jgi:hypothetical protein
MALNLDVGKDRENLLPGIVRKRLESFRPQVEALGRGAFGKNDLVLLKKQVKIFDTFNAIIHIDAG